MARGSLVAGARVRIRDAEWVVGHVEKNSVAGSIIHATGLSGIVRDKNAIFVESVEKARGRGIEVIDPANVVLVPDKSSGYSDTLLHLEAALRKSAPTGLAPQVAKKAAIDDLDFQLDPVRLALRAPRIRVLIGDDVGLGKTLEAGLLAAELILRRRARRILVVTTKAMLTQFQQELWTRFSIPLVRMDSAKIKQIRARIPQNQNPFDQFEKTIISIDTLKNDEQYRVSLEKSWWDLIIIDEAHNVAERGGPRAVSQRNVLAERLASRSDALVLLSATPHDGSRRSFASLMRMLDPTSIADPENYGPDDIQGLFLRRFRTTPAVKEALKSKVKARDTQKLDLNPSPAEEALYDALANLSLREDASPKKGQRLFKTLLEKSLFSSPAAFLETLRKRIARLEEQPDGEAVADVKALSVLLPLAEAIDDHSFTRYQRLLKLLKSDLKWKASKKDDRLVIFSERIATLEWLAQRLRDDLGLDESQVATLHASGAGSDVKAQQIVEDFGIEKKPIRILLASDMASEGLNLHYLSHKLIHFDIPWALLKFQQRNGRIDRYGQERTPHVWYLVAHPQQEKIKGDLRILERLIERDLAAQENIRDPSVFLGTNDEEAQEDVVADAMEAGTSAEEFDTQMDERARQTDMTEGERFAALEDFFLAAQESVDITAGQGDGAEGRPSAFGSSFDFTVAALRRVQQLNSGVQFTVKERVITLDIPDDFRERTAFGAATLRAIQPRFMPPEAEPDDGRIRLTDDRQTMSESIRRSRQGTEDGWPQFQYLWDVHPVVDWLADKVSGVFGRGKAPVALVRGHLKSDEVAFVFNGMVPNLKGHPLVDEWPVVLFRSKRFHAVEPAAAFLDRIGLGYRDIPNVGDARSDDIVGLIEEAVGRAQTFVHEARKKFDYTMSDELLRLAEKRDQLLDRHRRRIADLFDKADDRAAVRNRREREERRLEDEFDQWWDWIEKTRQTQDDPNPYVRLVAAFRG
jgi:superfamily II DNA or RNA helicase